jgi:predicted lipoprotein with Yx(FWY)xxD motif
MKTNTTLIIAAALALAASSTFAAGKPCEELKTEIAGKLDAKGVKGYTLDIVDADKAGDAKVVGSCEGGAKKITYAKK